MKHALIDSVLTCEAVKDGVCVEIERVAMDIFCAIVGEYYEEKAMDRRILKEIAEILKREVTPNDEAD